MRRTDRAARILAAAANSGNLRSDDARVLRYGSHVFEAEACARNLAAATAHLDDCDAARAWWAEVGLSSFEPDRFFLNLRRLAEAPRGAALLREISGDPARAARLAVLLAGSQFLTEACLADARLLHTALAASFLAPPDRLPSLVPSRDHDASAARDDEALRRRLFAFKTAETLRVALADLSRSWDTPTVLARISGIAAATIQRALDTVSRDLSAELGEPSNAYPEMPGDPADFAVLGLGKLGGRELNFSSDIDLVYLFRTEQGRTTGGKRPPVANAEYYEKLAQRLTRLLGASHEQGWLYRVDLRLRPAGRSGHTAVSLRAAEMYYEYWGETWERQALLQCRAVAGSVDLADAFIARIRPFLWRRTLDLREIEEIRRSKRAIDEDLLARRGEALDLKLSPGGIREVEFIAQAFQLIYGGREPALRVRGTLPTLQALASAGLMPEDDVTALREAYLFLRELENRIQILEGRQTHLFPESLPARAALARKMGLGEDDPERSAARLIEALERHRRRVRDAFAQMFPESREEGNGRPAERRARMGYVAAAPTSEVELLNLLSRHRFRDPRQALAALRRLREGGEGLPATTGAKQRLGEILSRLIEIAGNLPDPDLALTNLERFADALGSREALFSTLADSSAWAQALLTLLGSSEYLSTILIAQPDFLESTFRTEFLNRAKNVGEIAAEFTQQLSSLRDPGAAALELRRLKRAEEVRVGLRHLLSQIDIEDTMAELSALADATVQTAHRIAREEVLFAGRVPQPQRFRFVVFLLGSAGARELVFNSDLDLFFVFEEAEDGLDAAPRMAVAARLAERTVRALSANLANGFAYRVDLRLRPEGEHGPLAIERKALERYLAGRASPWEMQAFLRCRPVAGELALGRRVLQAIRRRLGRTEFDAAALSDLFAMRERMGTERGKAGARYVDLKFGRGGILDVEFAAQILALTHHRVIARETASSFGNTLGLLRAQARKGLLRDEDARAFEEGFLFQKRLENRLRLTFERPASYVDKEAAGLPFLARLCGYSEEPEEEFLLNDLTRVRNRTRAAYDRLVERLCAVGE